MKISDLNLNPKVFFDTSVWSAVLPNYLEKEYRDLAFDKFATALHQFALEITPVSLVCEGVAETQFFDSLLINTCPKAPQVVNFNYGSEVTTEDCQFSGTWSYGTPISQAWTFGSTKTFCDENSSGGYLSFEVLSTEDSEPWLVANNRDLAKLFCNHQVYAQREFFSIDQLVRAAYSRAKVEYFFLRWHLSRRLSLAPRSRFRPKKLFRGFFQNAKWFFVNGAHPPDPSLQRDRIELESWRAPAFDSVPA